MQRLSRARTSLRNAFAVTTALTAVSFASSARADDLLGLGFLPGTTISNVFAISADGLVAVGHSDTPGETAFAWTANGGMKVLPVPAGAASSAAAAVSADGSVIVGQIFGTDGSSHAAIWSGGTVRTLSNLVPFIQVGGANGVSADGTVVVGLSSLEAFRWTTLNGGTMTGLGFLPGGFSSDAYAVSADGNVVVGNSTNSAGNYEAFRWTASTSTMTGLGTLAGDGASTATAVNADGSVVVGFTAIDGHDAGGNPHQAFRWTASGGPMTGLGFLPGDTVSQANAVNADGSVVVGFSSGARLSNPKAFRWTPSDGMQSVQALLASNSVNLSGWTLNNATGVSADGSIIVGNGKNAGHDEAWIARFGSQYGTGLITPGGVVQSFAGQAAIGQTGNAVIGGDLATFNQYATDAYASQGQRSTPYSVFAYGTYNSDPVAAGTLGITANLPDAMIIGGGISGDYVRTNNMVFDGNATMAGGSGGVFLARIPDAGLQWFVGLDGTALTGDVTRGYLNGSSPVSSHGNTDAVGYGATARIGWTFNDLLVRTQITPFVAYTYTNLHVNGYTETGGPFPAQMDSFDASEQTSRLGADLRYTFAPGEWLWGSAAWGHRLDGGHGPDIGGTLIGLFGVSAPGETVAADWLETTVGVRIPAWTNGAITASVTAAIPAEEETTYVARLGITQAF